MTGDSCYTILTGNSPGTFEIHLRGEIDLTRKPELHQIIAAYARSLACNVVVDLRQVTFFDVTGLALLVDLHREARVHGCLLRLQNLPPMPRRVIQIAGLASLLPDEQPDPAPHAPGLVSQRASSDLS
jgi:anti-anti-sigma factor